MLFAIIIIVLVMLKAVFSGIEFDQSTAAANPDISCIIFYCIIKKLVSKNGIIALKVFSTAALTIYQVLLFLA